MAANTYYSRLENRSAFKWEARSGGAWTPNSTKIVVGGKDLDGTDLYVGRVVIQNECIPGKVKLSHGTCYVPWDGKENGFSSYQVLHLSDNANSTVSWVASSGGQVPTGAVQGGVLADGKPLYIGRTTYQGSVVCGKIHPDHGTLYIPFGGEELGFSTYEVLCIQTLIF